jgi:anthranilate phosphoribosyltransferase
VEQNKIIKYSIHPSDFGLGVCKPGELTGGDAGDNAEILKKILKGEKGRKGISCL